MLYDRLIRWLRSDRATGGHVQPAPETERVSVHDIEWVDLGYVEPGDVDYEAPIPHPDCPYCECTAPAWERRPREEGGPRTYWVGPGMRDNEPDLGGRLEFNELGYSYINEGTGERFRMPGDFFEWTRGAEFVWREGRWHLNDSSGTTLDDLVRKYWNETS